jgi:hypothetical protein
MVDWKEVKIEREGDTGQLTIQAEEKTCFMIGITQGGNVAWTGGRIDAALLKIWLAGF